MKIRWIFVSLLIVGIAATAVWRGKVKKVASSQKPIGSQAVVVVIGNAEQKDVPIWLSGIGTVQASNTVTVRPRVNGSLDTVNFIEGATVKAGDVLAQIDPRPYQSVLAQAVAKEAQDQAQLANARLEAARFTDLLKNDAVSKQQLDQADATVAQLEALVQADQAAIQAAKLDLEFTTVRAPIAGRTGVRLVDAGNLVTANQGAGLVVLTQLQPISAIFTLPQQHLVALGQGKDPDNKGFVVQALNDNGTVLAEGTLELIDNQIDTATGTLRLKATFTNDNLTLWPGQFVSARVLVEIRRNAVVVPTEAVQPGLEGEFCYVVKEDSTVEPRSVKPTFTIEGKTVINEGLKAGERIIVVGQSKLKPGAKVTEGEKQP